MDKNYAIKLIQDVFQNPFNREQYLAFSKNLFNHLDVEKNFLYRGNLIPDAYDPYIKTLERIGKYEDAEGNKIDILIVHLKKERSIEHARTMQRNFIAWYLGSRGDVLKDAALVAFHTDNPDDWRFSLVKMDYQIVESATGKIKTKTELTPARRFSFLVGKNENSHTAQRQLLPTLQDDKNNPLLSDLEKAFNIEVVTQEFFEKYKSLFLDVKDSLDRLMKKDQAIAKDFVDKGVDPVDFSKKLLGQIVFLYFLQKKGWFGVERDSDWGTGPKNFLRLLFEKMIANYKNFFNDILEPLFYEALAKERDDDFYSRFNCKIPFLNGGLFDPLSDYDWIHTDILLPDELFSNQVKTKEGDTGTGILDIFDRYNFTVKEDEPLEKEVAVDPEMLGKVFENLLEVKDRKSKGTYYTPREIVHYMCQESLINYLVNECEGKVGRIDIETLIQYGETAVEHDSRVEQEGKETKTYSYKLPESIRKNAELLDDKLKNIRVCDPAIGSGAFPVGMMNEIIRTRNTLTNYLEDKADRSVYSFKRDTIQNSLYGVDIDPGAVEIAKLRLWLSLVVDEEDIKQIKPLPNLDYKIMQGNSLLEEFVGVRLFDEELISKPSLDDDRYMDDIKERITSLQREYIQLHSAGKLTGARKIELEMELKKQGSLLRNLTRTEKSKSENTGLFDMFSEAKKKAQELKQLHKEFFEASQKTKKDELKKRIENLEWELIETTLKEQNKVSALKQLEQYKKANIKPFFLWKLNFSEIFQEKNGFDVVIGNPPYARIQGIDKSVVKQYKNSYKSATGRFDLYVLFVEKGLELASTRRGQVNFIMPHKWTNASYGKGLRELISGNNNLTKLISFGAYQVFNASTYTSIIWLKKITNGKMQFNLLDKDLKINDELDDYLRKLQQNDFAIIDTTRLNGTAWVLTNSKVEPILDKLRKQPLKISDVFEGTYQGVVTTGDDIFYLKGEIKGKDFRGFSERIKQEVVLEANCIKPLLMGDDISRYVSKLKNKVFVIYPHYRDQDNKTKPLEEDQLKKLFPRVYKYLLNFKNELSLKKVKYKTNPKYWYALHRSREIEIFEQQKIITPYLSIGSSMTLDTQKYYTNAKCYNLIKKRSVSEGYKFYLAILNSNLLWFYLKNTGTMFRGGYFAFTSDYLDKFPLPKMVSSEIIKLLEDKVDLIFSITSKQDHDSRKPHMQQKNIEMEIDQIIYKLYGLTPEDIEIIDG